MTKEESEEFLNKFIEDNGGSCSKYSDLRYLVQLAYEKGRSDALEGGL